MKTAIEYIELALLTVKQGEHAAAQAYLRAAYREVMESAPYPNEIAVFWHVNDLIEILPEASLKERSAVLKAARVNHDATVGVNYEVLEETAAITLRKAP